MTEPLSKFEQDLIETLRRQQPSVPEQALERVLSRLDVSSVTDPAPARYSYYKKSQSFIHNCTMTMRNAWKIIAPAGVIAVVAVAVMVSTTSPTPVSDSTDQRQMVAADLSGSALMDTRAAEADTTEQPAVAKTAATGDVTSDVDAWFAEFETENQTVLAGFDDTDMLSYDSAESAGFDSAYNPQEM